MRKLLPVVAMLLTIFIGCSKKDVNTQMPASIVGVWSPDETPGKDEVTALKFTAEGRFYTWVNGEPEIVEKDNGQYKLDGHSLTTSFIDRYFNGKPEMTYDTTTCTISGDKMILGGSTHFTRQDK